jgi:hypothetical protein
VPVEGDLPPRRDAPQRDLPRTPGRASALSQQLPQFGL